MNGQVRVDIQKEYKMDGEMNLAAEEREKYR
jgi:hypothetical protein